jgi:RNA polymerase sigma-70 factor (ECF subfamily)
VEHQNSSQSEPSDELLVTRVKQRDVAAFTVLYDRYVQPVYAMAVYMVGNADAEEIVQEMFLRLWQRADQFDAERGSFKSWFMSAARYRILDELRQRNQEEGRRIVAEDISQVLANAKDPMIDIEKEVGLREDNQAILQALWGLPAEQRHALILAYFGGLSQSSIAQHLGWPLGTVKKRIRLGMQKLRAALEPQKLVMKLPDNSTSTDAK